MKTYISLNHENCNHGLNIIVIVAQLQIFFSSQKKNPYLRIFNGKAFFFPSA